MPLDQVIEGVQDLEGCVDESGKLPAPQTSSKFDPEPEPSLIEACPRFIPVGGTGFFRLRGPSIKRLPPSAPTEDGEEKEVWRPPTEIIPPTAPTPQKISPSKSAAGDDTHKSSARVLLCKICG